MAKRKKMAYDEKTANRSKSNKAVAIAIVAVIVFLLIACIRMQMELNELRNDYEEKKTASEELRLSLEELEYLVELKKQDPDAYREYVADKLGYYDPSSTLFNNGNAVN